MELFLPMPSDLSPQELEDEAMPIISQLLGTSEFSEHLGIAVKEGYNGSINAHININARMMSGEFLVSEDEAFKMIANTSQ